MKKVTAKYLDELAEKIKAQCGKDPNYLKTFINKAISVQHRVGCEGEFLFCYVIARDEHLWSQLTKLASDGKYLVAIGNAIPKAKEFPILGNLIRRAESNRKDTNEEEEKWLKVLKESSPLFKYKIDNSLAKETFGKQFDTFFSTSALSDYDRWKDDIVLFHDYRNGVNHCMRDFVSIIVGLAEPDRVVRFIQKGVDFFATPHVLQTLTPQQLLDLYRSQHSQLPGKVLDFIFDRFKPEFEGVSLFVSFVCKLTPEDSENFFKKLYLISQPRYAFFIESLESMASEKKSVQKYESFWKNLFSTNQNDLISIVLSNMSINNDEFKTIIQSDYCHPNHIANNLTDPNVMGAFSRLELPLTEDYVRVILMSLVNSELMLVLANGGLDFYMNTLRAFAHKSMSKLDSPEVRNVVVDLFCKSGTRERFFSGMTRPQFIRLINSCEYEDNSRRVSQTFFQELQSGNNNSQCRFSSVLKCTDEITNPVFHDELSRHPSL